MTPELLFRSDHELRAFIESLRTAQIGKWIEHRQRTRSTNDLALQAAREGAPHGQLFSAEVQDAGRGRRGRKWECPAGLGLLFSVIVRPEALLPPTPPSPQRGEGGALAPGEGVTPDRSRRPSPHGGEGADATATGWIPLVTGLACAEAIGAVCGLKLAAKWPNDVVLPCAAAPGWKKLGGILCESAIAAEGAGTRSRFPNGRKSGHVPGYVVIGIGLNLNHGPADLPAQARTPPTSILLETGKPCDRKEVFRTALERLEQHLLELYNPAASPSLKQRLESQLRHWWSAHRTITVQSPANGRLENDTVRGRFLGLDEQGRLAVQDEHGRRRAFADAEVWSIL